MFTSQSASTRMQPRRQSKLHIQTASSANTSKEAKRRNSGEQKGSPFSPPQSPLKIAMPTSPIKPEFKRRIRLTGVPPSESIPESLDVMIDAGIDEPFCLEPLESLIQEHAQEGKDFILARVRTVDPKDPTRSYHDYYAAHHINKVLFRTQPEEGLLHRMRANNPLNNMEIQGDVHYYVIRASEVKSASPLTPSDVSPSLSDTSGTYLSFDRMLPTPLEEPCSLQRGRKPARFFDRVLQQAKYWANFKDAPVDKEEGPTRRRLYLIMRPEVWENGVQKAAPVSTGTPRRSSFNLSTANGEGGSSKALNSNRRNSADDALVKIQTSLSLFGSTDDTKPLLGADSTAMDRNIRSGSISPTRSGRNSIAKKAGKNYNRSSFEYHAAYFATDDDFLMKEEVRRYFKEQALDQEHAVLFTLGALSRNGDRVALPSTHPHPTMENFEYQLAVESSWAVLLLELKTIKNFILGYLGLGTLIIVLFVPNEYVFGYVFGMLFLLCLALIIYL